MTGTLLSNRLVLFLDARGHGIGMASLLFKEYEFFLRAHAQGAPWGVGVSAGGVAGAGTCIHGGRQQCL